MIALLGSVFSPYYAWSGRRDPLNHCALNVALYGQGGHRWAMTERGRGSVLRSRSELAIGTSCVAFDGTRIVIDVNETTAPFPTPLRGRIVIHPLIETTRSFNLDAAGRHVWWPVAPRAKVEVTMSHPALSWSGHGYVDANAGAAPLEQDFKSWNWSHARLNGRSAVFYDVQRRDGTTCALGIEADRTGGVTEIPTLPAAPLACTAIWRMPRRTRADHAQDAVVLRTLEDTPFYSRSTLAARVLGETTVGMHESLCLDRFSHPIIRGLLPFRNPRALWPTIPRTKPG